jgi:hypothetical protein
MSGDFVSEFELVHKFEGIYSLLSRAHLLIEMDSENPVLYDLRSTHGSFLDDVRFEKESLPAGTSTLRLSTGPLFNLEYSAKESPLMSLIRRFISK